MHFPKYLFFAMTLISVIFVSYFVSYLFGFSLFSWRGYDFLAFGIVLSFVYFTEKNLRFTDSVIAVVFLSVLDAFFRRNTAMGETITAFPLLLIYSAASFLLCLVLFHLVWFNKKFRLLRNVLFSIFAGISFFIVHFLTHVLTGIEFHFSFIYYALLIMLSVSFAFTLAEVLFNRFEKIWTIPERIVLKDDNAEDDE